MSEAPRVIAALREGRLAVLPTDTVYGLACIASSRDAAAALYRLKGREAIQPTAVVCASIECLLELVPGLPEDQVKVARALLPGPYTLVVSNPARRFAWLNTPRPEAIGVRVPLLPPPAAAVVEAVAAVVATSANLPGGPDPRRLSDVPAQILAGVAAVLDGGVLPGTPSTVVDLTGSEPAVVREGAVAAGEALTLVAAALT